MTKVRGTLRGLCTGESLYFLSCSHFAGSRRSRALTYGRETRGVQVHARKHGRAVYHGVAALPHKSRNTGPPLISLFNLRVRNNFARHLYEQVVAGIRRRFNWPLAFLVVRDSTNKSMPIGWETAANRGGLLLLAEKYRDEECRQLCFFLTGFNFVLNRVVLFTMRTLVGKNEITFRKTQ